MTHAVDRLTGMDADVEALLAKTSIEDQQKIEPFAILTAALMDEAIARIERLEAVREAAIKMLAGCERCGGSGKVVEGWIAVLHPCPRCGPLRAALDAAEEAP